MKNTVWEKIYAQYTKTGEKWASLGDPIHSSFFSFIRHTKFGTKSALDLGCGNGKYLRFLQDIEFNTTGVDSSSTAIKIAKKILKKKTPLHVADIYAYPIPAKKYDLIISIATIQHSKKKTIKKLIDRIYKSLLESGWIFITFPQTKSLHQWATFKTAKQITPGTFVPLSGPEKGLPHSFYKKSELKKLFSKFKKVKIISDDRGRWIVQASH